MSLMIVYNTCGISGRENATTYIENIKSIMRQDLQEKTVIFSGCSLSKNTFKEVYKEFGNKISYHLTNDKLAVNQTFNHAVLKGVEAFGEHDGYMYVASDVNFSDDKGSLERLHKRLEDPGNGIISPEIDKDNGYYWWFGFEENENIWDVFGREKDFVVPLGSTANLHCKIFSNKIFKEFGRPLPDVFVSYCTESTFSFLAAAVQQRFIITNDVLYKHGADDGLHQGLDGQTQAFGAGWDVVFPGCRSMREIVHSEEAAACGFGHEEWVPKFSHKMDVPDDKVYLMHDKDQFDENDHSVDDRLKTFIRENLFLKPDVLNFEEINHKFVRQS